MKCYLGVGIANRIAGVWLLAKRRTAGEMALAHENHDESLYLLFQLEKLYFLALENASALGGRPADGMFFKIRTGARQELAKVERSALLTVSLEFDLLVTRVFVGFSARISVLSVILLSKRINLEEHPEAICYLSKMIFLKISNKI